MRDAPVVAGVVDPKSEGRNALPNRRVLSRPFLSPLFYYPQRRRSLVPGFDSLLRRCSIVLNDYSLRSRRLRRRISIVFAVSKWIKVCIPKLFNLKKDSKWNMDPNSSSDEVNDAIGKESK